MSTEKVKAALAAMRARWDDMGDAPRHDVGKLLAVAEAAQRASEAERAYRVANDKHRATRWSYAVDKSVIAEAKASHEAARKEGREARKALKAALAALGEP